MTLSPDEIKSLTVGQLRLELHSRHLPTDGLKNALAQRLMQHCFQELQDRQLQASSTNPPYSTADEGFLAASASSTRKISGSKRRNINGGGGGDRDLLKRVKKSFESSLMEYVCPISRELPLDPVIALDGQIYERSKIMYWLDFKNDNKNASANSPVTNEKIGKTLIDAPRVYNAIEKLVAEDEMMINSDLAKSWLKRVKDRKAEKNDVSAMRAAANGGDNESMYNLGLWYESGAKGLPKDVDEAIHWFKKSSDANHPAGMFAYGSYLLCPEGKIKRNIQYGTFLVAKAACEGSTHACYTVGEWYHDGKYGFPKDLDQTKHYWYLVAHRLCEYDDMDDGRVEEAEEWLDKHE